MPLFPASSGSLAATLGQTMRVYLLKKNKKTTDFVLLEAEDKFVHRVAGKIGKSGIANSSLNAGSVEEAKEEIERQTKELKSKGFFPTEEPYSLVTRDVVFDKAKWHLNEDFPKELPHYQSYVHTGLYICWLLEVNLYEQDFKNQHSEAIQQLLSHQRTPAQFYEQILDGVFDSDGLTQEAIQFTTDYFDFSNGKYVQDYLAIYDSTETMPTIFHVADTWENYDKLKDTLNKRLEEWRKKRSR